MSISLFPERKQPSLVGKNSKSYPKYSSHGGLINDLLIQKLKSEKESRMLRHSWKPPLGGDPIFNL